MASIFNKDPATDRPLSNFDRIAPEVAHLKKSSSVRHGPGEATRRTAPYLITLLVCALLWLYGMDTVLYAWHKSEAIRVYLYLHNYGSQSKIDALLSTHMFTGDEISIMNSRQGSFQDYFPSRTAAEQKADSIVDYIHSVADLHAGKYDKLDDIGKLRDILFIRPGLFVPTQWDLLNPAVK